MIILEFVHYNRIISNSAILVEKLSTPCSGVKTLSDTTVHSTPSFARIYYFEPGSSLIIYCLGAI